MRDITDNTLRRAAAKLGYTGKHFPLRIATVLVHANRPGDWTLLQYNGETRRNALERLRNWVLGGQE